jgi:hypothetical protein
MLQYAHELGSFAVLMGSGTKLLAVSSLLTLIMASGAYLLSSRFILNSSMWTILLNICVLVVISLVDLAGLATSIVCSTLSILPDRAVWKVFIHEWRMSLRLSLLVIQIALGIPFWAVISITSAAVAVTLVTSPIGVGWTTWSSTFHEIDFLAKGAILAYQRELLMKLTYLNSVFAYLRYNTGNKSNPQVLMSHGSIGLFSVPENQSKSVENLDNISNKQFKLPTIQSEELTAQGQSNSLKDPLR